MADRPAPRDLLIADFWDALDADPAAPDPVGLDPATVTRLRRLHALAHAQLPAGVQTRVQATIDRETARRRSLLNGNGKGTHVERSVPLAGPFGPALPRPNARPRPRPAGWLLPAATAAVLVLLLGLTLALLQRADTPTTPAVLSTPASLAPAGWSTYGGDAARDRVASGPGLAAQPSIRWRYPAPGVTNAGGLIDRAAAADGTLYLPSSTGTLVAVDVRTGQARWRIEGSGQGVAIDGDGLIALGNLPLAGAAAPVDLVRLSRADGSVVWRAEVGQIDPNSTPVIVDGVGYIPSGTGLLAFDPSTGEAIWRAPLSAPATRGVAVRDGLVVVGQRDGTVAAFAAANGAPRWTYATGAPTLGQAAIASGTVYVPASGGGQPALEAIDAASGALRWRFVIPTGARPRAVAATADTVYVPTYGATLYALDAATGAVRWSFDTGATNVDSVALAGGIVHFATDRGIAFGLDAATGAERWRLQLPAASNAAAMVVDGTYVLSTDGGAVFALASPATWVRDLTGDATRTLAGPGQMAFDPQGRLWVSSAKTSNFFIFGRDGALLETWGEPGAGPGQFAFSDGGSNDLGNILFAPDGRFYVADFMNARIQQFDKDRQFVRAWGTKGTAEGQFLGPLGLAFDTAGNLLVSDLFRNDVQRFTPDGKLIGAFGTAGAGPGQFAYAGPITRMPDGTLWIADVGNRRFQVFNDDGTFVRSVELHGDDPALALGAPAQVMPVRPGVLLVADQATNTVYVMDEQGTWLGQWGGLGSGPGQFNSPGCLALTPDGHVYVLDWRNNRVQEFTLAPDLLTPPAATPTA